MFAQYIVQRQGGAARFDMVAMGELQLTLEILQTLIELLQVALEFLLAAVVDGQHQYGELIQHRQQLVPVQPPLDARMHGLGLSHVALGQGQFAQQFEQGGFDMAGHAAVGWLKAGG